MIRRIELPAGLDTEKIEPEIAAAIDKTLGRIEAFQDCWDHQQIEQFVAADYGLVYQALRWMRDSQPRLGNRFLEWGSGFAVVSCLAASLGLDAIGIEAEQELSAKGRKTVADWNVDVELITGNFLPEGSESLSDDPMLPSLGHSVPCGYGQLEMELSDFAVVYSYPWPGEDDFHELVFDRYAETGAMLLQFCGPNDVRLWRKR